MADDPTKREAPARVTLTNAADDSLTFIDHDPLAPITDEQAATYQAFLSRCTGWTTAPDALTSNDEEQA